ncbi:hypothetical protein ACHAXS_013999 [Conticribra weissflogii]
MVASTPAKSPEANTRSPPSNPKPPSSSSSFTQSSGWSWRHRLYASLLRHALGPYLTPRSASRLHRSIQEVDWSDGRLALEDLELDPDYLTGLIPLENSSTDSLEGEDLGTELSMNVAVQSATIRRLAIHLSICDIDSKSSGASTARRATSIFLRSIFGSGENSETGCDDENGNGVGVNGMALIAHVELEGLDVTISPGTKMYHRIYSKKNNNSTTSSSSLETKNTNAVSTNNESAQNIIEPVAPTRFFSSLVESAMKSLRLSINISDAKIRVSSSDNFEVDAMKSKSKICWVGLHLESVRYFDLIDDEYRKKHEGEDLRKNLVSKNNVGRCTEKVVISKAVDWEGLTIQTGPGDEDRMISILKSERGGGIRFRVIEKLSGFVDQKVPTSMISVRKDVNISFGKGLAAHMDMKSLMILHEIANELQGGVEPALFVAGINDDSDSYEDALFIDNDGTNKIDSLDCSSGQQSAQGLNLLTDEFSKETYDRIMKQYTETRHLARTRELRGGLLVPSFGDCDGADESAGGEISFDAFFDANDHSVSYYCDSFLEENGIVCDGTKNAAVKGCLEQTKMELDLVDFVFTLYFNETSVAENDALGEKQSECMQLFIGGFQVIYFASEGESKLNCSVTRFGIDCEIFDNIDSTPGSYFTIHKSLLQFTNDADNSANTEIFVSRPPCISFLVEFSDTVSENERERGIRVDLMLQPMEIMYVDGLVDHLNIMIGEFGKPSDQTGEEEKKQIQSDSIHLSISCESIAFVLPCPNCGQYLSKDSTPNALFRRCSYKDKEAQANQFLGLGLELDNISCDFSRKKTCSDLSSKGTEESKAVVKFSRALLFAKSTQLERSRKSRKLASYISRRMDLMALSGDEDEESDAFVVVSFSRVVQRVMLREGDQQFKKSGSFPIVLPLSVMRSRQENDESDLDEFENLYAEAINSVEYPSTKLQGYRMKPSDPQYILSSEANEAERELVINIPKVFFDTTTYERLELTNILSLFGKKSLKTQRDGNEDIYHKQQKPKILGFSLNVGQISLVFHGGHTNKALSHYSFSFIIDKMKLHTLVTHEGVRNVRMLSHDFTLYEIYRSETNVETHQYPSTCAERCKKLQQRFTRNPSTRARAIFFRSKLCQPLSPDTPSVLIDILFRKDQQDNSNDGFYERSVHVSIYDMTYRYDMESEWLHHLSSLIMGSSKSNIDQDHETGSRDEFDTGSVSSLLNLFVNFTDCNVDYTSSPSFKNASRVILRIGEVRFTSNILTPSAPVQAYKLSLSDLCIHICNYRHPLNEENALLSCAHRYFHSEDLFVSTTNQQTSSQNLTSLDNVLSRMDFVCVFMLDVMDAIIFHSNRIENESSKSCESDPAITIALTLGRLALHACQDSFSCLNTTYNEWFNEITALSEEALEALRVASESRSNIGGTEIKSELCACTLEPAQYDDQLRHYVSDPISSHFLTKTQGPLLVSDHDESLDKLSKLQTSRAKNRNIHRDDTVSLDLSKSLLFQNYYTIDAKNKTDSVIAVRTTRPNARNERTTLFSNSLSSDEEWTAVEHDFLKYSSIPRDQEQCAKWISCDDNPTTEAAGNQASSIQQIKVFPQHVPSKPVLDPLSSGVLDYAKLAGTKVSPDISLRVIVKDASMVCRFYDGSDWVSDSHTAHFKKSGSQDRKRELLGNLIAGGDNCFSSKNPEPILDDRERRMLQNKRKARRNIDKYFQISLEGLKLRLDSFTENIDHLLASCLDLSISDFFVAECITNRHPVKMLGEWVNEREHPRDNSDGIIMLKMVTQHPVLRVSADGKLMSDESRATLELLPLRCFFNQSAIRYIQRFFSTNANDSDSEDYGDALDEELINVFFQTFKVFPCKLKVDYMPEKMDVDAFRDGNYVEILNLCPLEEMVLTLKEVENHDLSGWGSVFRELAGKWIEDICATQAHKFFTKAAPIQVFSGLGEGVADLVIIPLAVSDGNFTDYIKCLLEGTSSFAEKALRTSAKITQFAANQLNSNLTYVGQTSSRPLPRPQNVPKHAGDAAGYACESIVRGLREANYKIVTIPCREYQQRGPGGAARSAVKGIPVAVLAPLSGVSEALSYTLIGLRNQLRPDLRKEEEASLRGL